MIISGTISLSPAAHAAATASLRSRLSDLEARRLSAERTVTGLLSTWRGDAAAAFRERWEEWDGGARSVLDDLTAALDAADRARLDVTDADDHRAVATALLTVRLG
jgi:WXG100 family type VII secretion target